MVPPLKRRRLLGRSEARDEMAIFEVGASHPTKTSDIAYTPNESKRSDGFNLGLQRRHRIAKLNTKAMLQRRQATSIVPTTDIALTSSIDLPTAVSTAATTSDALPVSTTDTATATTSAISSATPTSTTSPTTTQAITSSASPPSPASASASPTVRPNKSSTSTTSRGKSTATSTRETSSTRITNSRQSTKSVFLVTLTNSRVKTVTRSPKPFKTTFADGETSTVCGTNGQCRLSAQSTQSRNQPTQSDLLSSTTSTGGNVASASASASAATGSIQQQHNDNTNIGPTATIAGGVVGGAAGLAILLVVALIFLRWYKRRLQQNHPERLQNSDQTPLSDYHNWNGRSGMAERAGLSPLVGALPALFRHQDKSLEDPYNKETGGFARVSGRKLPSRYNDTTGYNRYDAMSPPPSMPLRSSAGKETGETAFYRDGSGFYGEDGTQYELSESPEPRADHPFADPIDTTNSYSPASLTLSPGPQRTPTIHQPSSYADAPGSWTPVNRARSPAGDRGGLSPYAFEPSGSSSFRGRTSATASGNWSGRFADTYARSETPSSVGDNRSSRFTEDF